MAPRRPWLRRGPHLAAIGCVVLGLGVVLRDLERAARHRRARAEITRVHEAVRMYCLALRRPLPERLDDLFTRPWGDCYPPPSLDTDLVDPWGRPWICESAGPASFRVRSLGADGLPGGEGCER